MIKLCTGNREDFSHFNKECLQKRIVNIIITVEKSDAYISAGNKAKILFLTTSMYNFFWKS